MPSVLVTGANGFIGKKLVSALKSKDKDCHVYEISSDDGDIALPSTLCTFQKKEIDFVFHLAARTYVPDSWKSPGDFQHTNVGGTINVLELCRDRKIPLTFVSGYLYGIPEKLPIKETDHIQPNNPYALSKFLAESICKFYSEHYNIPITTIRPFNIFGQDQKKHFLIPEIIEQIKGQEFILLQDLTPRRDYLFIDDLIDALLLTMKPKEGYNVYNIGYGSSLSVAEIVEIIQEVARTALPVMSKNMPRENEISDVYADIDKAAQELNWKPGHTFKAGIEKIFLNETRMN